MKYSFSLRSFLCAVALFALPSGSLLSQKQLDRYLQIELKRLEETYSLLDTFADQVWPGWKNYTDIEFRIQFPNLAQLLYNPRKGVPQGYEPLPGAELGNKPVYLNTRQALPMTPRPPLIGGGGGGLTITMRLSQLDSATVANDSANNRWTDEQIMLYIHEFFHGHQKVFEKEMKNVDQRALFGYLPTVEYATYSEIEGEALLRAYQEQDSDRAREYMKDYVVCLLQKHKQLTPILSATENSQAMLEGTAMYAQVKLASYLGKAHYQPRITPNVDPYFFGYRYLNDYVKGVTIHTLDRQKGATLEILSRHYTYGLFQCLLLDRFMPNWKTGFLESHRTQAELIQDLFPLSQDEEQLIASRIKVRYQWDTLAARHGRIIHERDSAITLVKGRTGKRYIVDFQRTKEFFQTKARGKTYRIGSTTEQVFPSGLERLSLGEVELTSAATPMHRTGIWTVAWVDTDTTTTGRGYEVQYAQQDSTVMKNVTVTTEGFTLRAPEIEIKESPGEVRIFILSKMKR